MDLADVWGGTPCSFCSWQLMSAVTFDGQRLRAWICTVCARELRTAELVYEC